MTDREAFREQLREAFGFPTETWAKIEELAEFDRRVRERDQARMLAHMEHVRATLPDRLRAEGYDLPEGVTLEWGA